MLEFWRTSLASSFDLNQEFSINPKYLDEIMKLIMKLKQNLDLESPQKDHGETLILFLLSLSDILS